MSLTGEKTTVELIITNKFCFRDKLQSENAVSALLMLLTITYLVVPVPLVQEDVALPVPVSTVEFLASNYR